MLVKYYPMSHTVCIVFTWSDMQTEWFLKFSFVLNSFFILPYRSNGQIWHKTGKGKVRKLYLKSDNVNYISLAVIWNEC